MNYELKRVITSQWSIHVFSEALALSVLTMLAHTVSAEGLEAICKAMRIFGT